MTARVREWQRVDRVRRNLEPAAQRLIRRELSAENGRLLAQHVPDPASLLFDPVPWRNTLQRVWRAVGEPWWELQVDGLLRQFPEKQIDPDTIRRLANNPGALRAIAVATVSQAERIVDQSRRLLLAEFDKFDRTLRQAIRAMISGGSAKSRSVFLARQVVLEATAKLQHEAAVATERALLKEWLSRGDDRVRATHSTADAAYSTGSSPGPIPLESHFEVGGSFLLHPRDPSGALKEIINCRCQTRYVPDRRRNP